LGFAVALFAFTLIIPLGSGASALGIAIDVYCVLRLAGILRSQASEEPPTVSGRTQAP
jgi:hypothetical protein